MTVHENIRKFRKEKRITQKQLGDLCEPKIAEANIRKYELGKANPKVETLERIAKALGVKLSDLYGETSNITTLFAGGSAADAVFMQNVEKILNEVLVKQGLEAQDIKKDIAQSTTEMMKTLGQSTVDNLQDILEPYSKLNDKGKQKAVEYTNDLTQIDEYTKE